jgi:hypothetical protein
MTDTDEDPAITKPPAIVPWSKRSGTLLGRLVRAVRDQNWFAVIVELLIVIVGVAIGFQVTAWGQGKTDRVKEQIYIRQLVSDLRETEREVERIDRVMVRYDNAARLLAQAYYLPDGPPHDSVMTWAYLSPQYFPVTPVVGTAEALVSTGDIGLIRDDSLRSAITAYLGAMKELVKGYGSWQDELIQHTSDYSNLVPIGEIFAAQMSPSELDSLDRAGSWLALVPPDVELPAFDAARFVRDKRTRSVMTQISMDKENMRWFRNEFRTSARRLRDLAEANLGE